MTATRRDALAATAGAAGLALAGPGAVAGRGPPSVQATVAYRAAHTVPDAPNLDVSLDGGRVLSEVPFGAVTEYRSAARGTHAVRVTLGGDPDAVVFDGEVTLEPGFWTLLVVGELADAVDARVLDDYDLAQLRLVHAVPDAPAVTAVARTGDGDADGGATTLFEGVAFGEVTGYVGLPAGAHRLELERAGDGGELLATFDAQLAAGGAYSALATGYLSPAGAPTGVPLDLVLAGDGPTAGDG